ncbi:hypothetical protein [Thermosulfurimonas dismutans]|uniref:Lipoprotein n=1 Tax=Thermosulfurimonas dismutans TaxID=999894 RepID=A0A179D650_9BACT|nr:hypothetical protein [Thermosulfurimonas dismutans]OAQ21516.1 hypothetical protein TDIS_0034 [Thermosulfurimonas dismutans]
MKRLLVLLGGIFILALACAPKALYLLDVTEPIIPPDSPQRPWIMIGSRNWGSSKLYRKLCIKGEFRQILAKTHLPKKDQKTLWEAACGKESSSADFVKAYYSLDEGLRINLRETLENHGYILNEFPC